MAGAHAAPRRDRRPASAGAVRRGSGAGRADVRGGGRAVPGLLQEPGHRRDDAAAGRAGRRVGACRNGGTPCSAASTSTCPKTAPCCTSRCGCRGRRRSSWTAPTWCGEVHEVLDRMAGFANRIRSGEWKGHTGQAIRNVINVGIGGSDLGPVMAYEALRHYATRDIAFRFVSNVDSTDFVEATRDLDPGADAVHHLLQDVRHAGDAHQRHLGAGLDHLGAGRGRGGQALRRGLDQRRAGREVRHRHGQHVRVLGLGGRPVLDGLGHRAVHHGGDRAGAVRRDAGRVP